MTTSSNTGSSRSHYFILIAVIILAGMSQGLLLPLLTILLEKMGIPSHLNGLNAAVLYLGTFAALFFVEKLLQRLGFKKLLSLGIILAMVAFLLFPVYENIWFWLILRFLVGVGDSALHYASQLWVLTMSTEQNRGRNLSFYGMSYGIGFSLGPLGINLLGYGDWAPFVAMVLGFLAILLVVLFVLPPYHIMESKQDRPAIERRYIRSFQWAWFAILPGFLYGYTESSMNSSFPIYALRTGFDQEWISFILPFFGVGGLILQMPLGMLSDKYGRKKVLMIAGLLGGMAFLAIPAMGSNGLGILILFMIAGGMLGSFYSLGLAYAADILPKALLPAANVVATFLFSISSIIAPNLGGISMEYLSISSIFWILGGLFIFFSLLGFLYRSKNLHEVDLYKSREIPKN